MAKTPQAAPGDTESQKPYHRQLARIYEIIYSELAAPQEHNPNDKTPFTLQLESIRDNMMRMAISSPSPVMASSRRALALSIVNANYVMDDFDLPDVRLDESLIQEAKLRLVEYIFGESERLGTREMLELVTYMRDIANHARPELMGYKTDYHERNRTKSEKKGCSSEESTLPAVVEKPDSASDAVAARAVLERKLNSLVRSTVNVGNRFVEHRVWSMLSQEEKSQLVTGIDGMRSEAISKILESQHNEPTDIPDSAIILLGLVKSLQRWATDLTLEIVCVEGEIPEKSRPFKLKLVELMYEAASLLSTDEMVEFLDSHLELTQIFLLEVSKLLDDEDSEESSNDEDEEDGSCGQDENC